MEPDWETEAERVANDAFGLVVSATPLPGELDRNYRLDAEDGRRVLLKLHRPDTDLAVLDLQDAALRQAASNDPALPAPRLLGRARVEACGEVREARLLTWLDGVTWSDHGGRDPRLLQSVGALVARVDAALAGLEHPAGARPFGWHPLQAAAQRDALGSIPDETTRALATAALDDYERLLPRLRALPRQLIHNDGHTDNLLVGGGRAAAIVDFGDVVAAPRVCGLAVACAYAALETERPLRVICEVSAGYHDVAPLAAVELELLFDLVRTRLAVSACMAARQSRADPGNEYLLVSQHAVPRALDQLAAENRHLAHFGLRDACGLEPSPTAFAVRSFLARRDPEPAPVVDAPLDTAVVLDWSTANEEVTRLARGGEVAALSTLVEEELDAAGATVGIGRYLEDRGVYAGEAFGAADPEDQRTVHVAIDLFLPAGEIVRAPLEGIVEASAECAAAYDFGPMAILRHETDQGVPFWTLYGHLSRGSLAGLEPGRVVARGEELARIGPHPENGNWPPHLHFQLLTQLLDLGTGMHGVAPPAALDVWESVSPDPNLILGLPLPVRAEPPRSRAWIERRRRTNIGRSLSLSYAEPLQIVRGEGAYLYDAGGRGFLDLVNNVAHVGHCHPRVTSAVERQKRVLDTNTRYLHPLIADYARRLAAMLPDPLSVVYLTNSGSEANDLALRIARVHTGASDTLVLDHAYHGNLSSLVAISPYKFNRAGGQGRPDGTWVCELPDPYKGRLRLDEAYLGRRYAEDVRRQLDAVEAAGRRPAAFVVETLPGCAGQIVLPDGYLEAAFAHARAAGAVCIADEVQTGFGRVGTHVFAFETQGVVPDIVTLGKPIGNGHPLGAVVTTPALARSFETGMEYFNTFGGNPVSCAAGLAVLDVLLDEGLQARARVLGARLLDGLRELAGRHELVGDVRGAGLFLGVELVTDRQTRAPATAAAAAAVEAAKARGVLLSTDGPAANVIKLKPPLVLSEADVDRALEVLETALHG